MSPDLLPPPGRDGIDRAGCGASTGASGELLTAGPAFVPRPAQGRVFTAGRGIRSTDATRDGWLRLDALARYLQDVAEDDLADAKWREPQVWLLRRAATSGNR